jgi:NAD(P)-dependent dehydrogenase (short-subunit alcohol dehydrogenase family)
MFELSGKTALVTGAGRNIGAGIARLLAQQGAAVAVNDLDENRSRETSDAIRAAGGTAVAAPFDVTSMEAVADGIARAQAALGPVDILVNNAGVPAVMDLVKFRDTTPEAWEPYLALNLYGVLYCTKTVIDGMCERGHGRVITISSTAGAVGTDLGVSLYAAGKGGAISFMRHLALEVARFGVTANTLAPGLVLPTLDATTASLAARIPVGRVGTPEDIGALVVYLASDEAAWVTGQTIHINGGVATT